MQLSERIGEEGGARGGEMRGRKEKETGLLLVCDYLFANGLGVCHDGSSGDALGVGPQGPDDPALRTVGPVQAYIQTEIARSNTPTKKYDVITICSDRRSEGQLSTAATTGPGMATGNALRREQAAIRRSDRRTHLGDVRDCALGDRSARRHTDFSLVLSGGRLRRRRNGITLSGAARERGALSAQHRLGQSRHDPRRYLRP
eukprot:scaffold7258_cov122-Isochrysis_galbana.AAC.3